MKYDGVVGAVRGLRTGTRKVGKKQRNGDLKIATKVKVSDVIKKKWMNRGSLSIGFKYNIIYIYIIIYIYNNIIYNIYNIILYIYNITLIYILFVLIL